MNLEQMFKVIKENNFEINNEINCELICTICKKILMNACNNARCGCRYCNQCINEYVKEENKACPGESVYCDKNEGIDINRDIHVDQPVNIKISKLLVKCPNIKCQSKIELKSMENHIRMCDKQFVHCPYRDLGCKENKLTNDEVGDHLSTEIHSHTKMLMEWMIDSRSNSESLKKDVDQLRNDNNDLKESKRLNEERSQNQREHMEKLKSDINDLRKIFKSSENIIQDLQRKEKENIIKITKLEEEMSGLLKDNKYLDVELKNQKQDMKRLKSDNHDLKENMSKSGNIIQDLQKNEKENIEEIQHLTNEILVLKMELEELPNQITQYFAGLGLIPQIEKQSGQIEETNYKIVDLIKEKELLKEKVKTIKDNQQDHQSQFVAQMEHHRQEINQLKQFKVEKTQFDNKLKIQQKNIIDIDKKLSVISRPIDDIQKNLNKAIQSIGKMQEVVDKTNYMEFVWKIEKWSEKRMQSRNGTISDIYSDSFFSNKNGYKMCLCVYLDGKSRGKSTYLATYFCIMKGPFDDILKWPFKHDVKISLINQQSGLDETTWSIKDSANNDCESFLKPINEINNGYGNDEFFLFKEIAVNERLNRNNQIFIKCSVKL